MEEKLYPNEEKTRLVGPYKAIPKYKQGPKKTLEQEIISRIKHKKQRTKRRKK